MLFKKKDDDQKRIEPVSDSAASQSTLERLMTERTRSLLKVVEHRRTAQRSDLRMIGEAHFDDMTASVLVVDGSTTGLRIKLYDPVELPEKFRVSVVSLQFDQEVTLAWQNDVEAGITF